MKKGILVLFLILVMSAFVFASSMSIGFTVGDKDSSKTKIKENIPSIDLEMYIAITLLFIVGFILFKKIKNQKSKSIKKEYSSLKKKSSKKKSSKKK